MAGRNELDDDGIRDLAEARWRTGDTTGAGEAAAAYLAAIPDDVVALVIAAEAQAELGRPGEARRLAGMAMEGADGSLEPIFAGMRRSSIWPVDAGCSGRSRRAALQRAPPEPRAALAGLRSAGERPAVGEWRRGLRAARPGAAGRVRGRPRALGRPGGRCVHGRCQGPRADRAVPRRERGAGRGRDVDRRRRPDAGPARPRPSWRRRSSTCSPVATTRCCCSSGRTPTSSSAARSRRRGIGRPRRAGSGPPATRHTSATRRRPRRTTTRRRPTTRRSADEQTLFDDAAIRGPSAADRRAARPPATSRPRPPTTSRPSAASDDGGLRGGCATARRRPAARPVAAIGRVPPTPLLPFTRQRPRA